MRIRTKPWARPELYACDYFIEQPEQCKGKWNQLFSKNQPLHLELGCGKGVFISELAYQNPNINYLAVDISMDILGVARRNVAQIFGETPVENLKLTSFNIEYIDGVLNQQDAIQRIYIYFCNPWSKKRHKKRRLTHTRQLLKYREFLADNGEIYFKTDDDELFEESFEYFEQAGFEIVYQTRDLHHSDYSEDLLTTEHEIKFTEQGIPTKFLLARKTNLPQL
ncbi:tRNA (guanosine(46)-N7)-methyltransferase TrmB [Massilioclostridium coli]|uniref:tRNA (guanosine(46)-N7)-methyltransferase TrmB n=1 Tax=Massilioclostridium coli TaxID=1870991 RepID=UPI0022E7E18E|nr:tRNA (guanosine(46)-N7)-methyltransferase TrmB [Massilioclostridium coli]